jgi:predicted heme/steroid binding protein
VVVGGTVPTVNSKLSVIGNLYTSGSLSVGGAPQSNTGLSLVKNITGAVTSYGLRVTSLTSSDVTTESIYVNTHPILFSNVPTVSHFKTTVNFFGGAVTDQNAFWVTSSTVGATNNYGFRGSIPAASTNWNIYIDGTAKNYLAGRLLIGSSTDNGTDILQVTGTANFSSSITANSITANSFIKPGGTAFQFLKADGTVDSNTYSTVTSGVATYIPMFLNSTTIQSSIMNQVSGTIYVEGNSPSGYGLDVTNVFGGDGIGVSVANTGIQSFGGTTGVSGASTSGDGIWGTSTSGIAIYGSSGSGIGLKISSGNAVIAEFYNGISVNSVARIVQAGQIYASGFIKTGGTSSQFLKADGSVDSTTYLTGSRTLTINGTTYDLSANRSWSVGTVTTTGSITAGYVPVFSGSTSIANSFVLRIVADDQYGLGYTVGINGDPTAAAIPSKFYVNGTSYFESVVNVNAGVVANAIIKNGGTASQFLKANGSVDSTAYTPSSTTLSINGVSYDLTGSRSWTVGTIGGSGSANYVAKFNGTSSLTTGILYDNGSAFGVNTTNPLATLHVAGGFIMENQFNRQTVNYTLVTTDAGKIVETNISTPNTVTVPDNATVPFPIGTEIFVMQYGAGQTTIAAVAGVTLRSKSNYKKIGSPYTGVCLVKVGTDEWYLVGTLVS